MLLDGEWYVEVQSGVQADAKVKSRLPHGTAYLETAERVGAALHQEAGVEEVVQLGVLCLLVVGEAAAVVLPSLPSDLAVAGEVAAVVQALTALCRGLQLERVAGVVGGEGRAWIRLSEEHWGVVVGEVVGLVLTELGLQCAMEEVGGAARAAQQQWLRH